MRRPLLFHSVLGAAACAAGLLLPDRLLPAIGAAPFAQGTPELLREPDQANAAGNRRKLTWDQIRKLEGTHDLRRQALEIIASEARTNPQAMLRRLEAMRESDCRLWDGRGALLAFWEVWISVDPEAAWQSALSEGAQDVLRAAAAAMLEINPDAVLAAAAVPDDLKLIARGRLIEGSATPPASDAEGSLRLHWLLTRPAVSWEDLHAAGGPREWMARKLVAANRAGVRDLLQSDPPVPNSGGEEARCRLTRAWFISATAEDLPRMLQVQPVYSFRSNVIAVLTEAFTEPMRRWDVPDLQKFVMSSPTDTFGDEVRQSARAAAVQILLETPEALAATLGDMPQYDWPYFPSIQLGLPRTPESLKAVEAILRAAGPDAPPNLLRSYAPFLMDMDLPLAANYIGQSVDTLKDEAAEVAQRWVRTDAAAATDWMLCQNGLNARAIAEDWSGTDPESCSAWVNTLPQGAFRDQAVSGLAERMLWYDPEMAAVWTKQIQNPDLRHTLEQSLAKIPQSSAPQKP